MGGVATLIGLLAFILSWHFYDFWGGPVPGYEVFLFAGNLGLVYIWHPLLTEEINLYPKLGLILVSQFMLVTATASGLQQLRWQY